MDPMRYLNAGDEERTIMGAIAQAADEIEEQRDLARANMIANAVGRMLGVGGQG